VRVFFFQAEDGIRGATVTGVQTCALPISGRAAAAGTGMAILTWLGGVLESRMRLDDAAGEQGIEVHGEVVDRGTASFGNIFGTRSEERRVGKEGRSRGVQ